MKIKHFRRKYIKLKHILDILEIENDSFKILNPLNFIFFYYYYLGRKKKGFESLAQSIASGKYNNQRAIKINIDSYIP